MEELRQKLETVQNAAETDQRQLVQSNEDIENLKKKLEETEKTVSEKESSLRTSKYQFIRVPWTVTRWYEKERLPKSDDFRPTTAGTTHPLSNRVT